MAQASDQLNLCAARHIFEVNAEDFGGGGEGDVDELNSRLAKRWQEVSFDAHAALQVAIAGRSNDVAVRLLKRL